MSYLSKLKSYLFRVGIAISVLFNVIFGGKSNQAFSARNFEWFLAGDHNMVWEIDKLLGQGHCMDCWDTWVRIEKVIEWKREQNEIDS